MTQLTLVSDNNNEKDNRNNCKKDAIEILDFLNRKAGKNFRPVEVNLNFIKARLESGISKDDLKSIIAMKVEESKNGSFDRKYLRPSTLFNREKCEQYYGELC